MYALQKFIKNISKICLRCEMISSVIKASLSFFFNKFSFFYKFTASTSAQEQKKSSLPASPHVLHGSSSSIAQHKRPTRTNLCLLEITTCMTCTGGKRLKISCSRGVKKERQRESNRDDDYQSRIVHYSFCSLWRNTEEAGGGCSERRLNKREVRADYKILMKQFIVR